MPYSGSQLAAPVSLSGLLRRGLERQPDAVAIQSLAASLTWSELDTASSRLASAWLAHGLQPGDRVASLMPNRVHLLIHYLACFKAGLVATPLNYRYTPPEIDHALKVSGASLLLAHAERQKDIASSAVAGKLPRGIVYLEGQVGSSPTLDDVLANGDELAEFVPPADSAPAIIYFTSGSTGKPKGVTHTHGSLGWMLASLALALELTTQDVVVPGTSHSHIAGSTLALGALAAGATVAVPRTIDGDELLPLFRTQRPTLLCMLPAALFSLVRDHGAQPEDFRSLRLCLAGGDKISQELEKEFTELTGLAIDEVYGMTEIGYTTLNPPSGINKMGSIGRACPGYQLSLRDDGGVESTDEGKLWVNSPTNMVGYWQNPEATAETIQNGWLDTGDLMAADSDGYFWFRGRKKQIIIHDGSNICPQEVEEALQEHPAIAEVGVIGVHDLIHGEIVRALVTLREGVATPSVQELIQFARARVGYKAPEEIVVLKQMPLNATGKIDRVALKNLSPDRTVV